MDFDPGVETRINQNITIDTQGQGQLQQEQFKSPPAFVMQYINPERALDGRPSLCDSLDLIPHLLCEMRRGNHSQVQELALVKLSKAGSTDIIPLEIWKKMNKQLSHSRTYTTVSHFFPPISDRPMRSVIPSVRKGNLSCERHCPGN